MNRIPLVFGHGGSCNKYDLLLFVLRSILKLTEVGLHLKFLFFVQIARSKYIASTFRGVAMLFDLASVYYLHYYYYSGIEIVYNAHSSFYIRVRLIHFKPAEVH